MIEWKTKGIFKANAEAVAMELESLEGECTPEEIVNKAKDERTELHKCFEWNDTEAARKWRLQQARLICCNLIYVEPRKPDVAPVRVLYKAESGNGYQQSKLIVRNQDSYQELLKRAMAELHSFKIRYACIHELDELFAMIE